VRDRAVDCKGGRCIICGYSKRCRSLHFHHVDPTQKDFCVNGAVAALSWKKIKLELDKCVLLCANCHGEVHDGLATFVS
jgi:hypothetical protein